MEVRQLGESRDDRRDGQVGAGKSLLNARIRWFNSKYRHQLTNIGHAARRYVSVEIAICSEVIAGVRYPSQTFEVGSAGHMCPGKSQPLNHHAGEGGNQS